MSDVAIGRLLKVESKKTQVGFLLVLRMLCYFERRYFERRPKKQDVGSEKQDGAEVKLVA